MDRWTEDDRAYQRRAGLRPSDRRLRVGRAPVPGAWNVGNFVVYSHRAPPGKASLDPETWELGMIWSSYTSKSENNRNRYSVVGMDPHTGGWCRARDIPNDAASTVVTHRVYAGVAPAEQPETSGELWLRFVDEMLSTRPTHGGAFRVSDTVPPYDAGDWWGTYRRWADAFGVSETGKLFNPTSAPTDHREIPALVLQRTREQRESEVVWPAPRPGVLTLPNITDIRATWHDLLPTTPRESEP